MTTAAAVTVLAYTPLPADVTEELQRWFRHLLWFVEAGLVIRLMVVGGKAGWEHFRPPPGPPEAPGDVVRALIAWSFAATAWPVAASLILDPFR